MQDPTRAGNPTEPLLLAAPAPGPSHDDIARLAYQLWLDRGAPEGSSELDWLQAESTLSCTTTTMEMEETHTTPARASRAAHAGS